MRLGLVPIAGAFSVLACGGDSTSPEGAHLVFKVQPSTVSAGQVIAPPVQVEVENTAGDVIASGTPTITLSVEPNVFGAKLSGQTSRTATAGVAVFSDLSITMSGVGYTLIAVTPDASGATSSGFNVRPLAPKAISGAGGDGQQAGVGSPVPQPPSVRAVDVYGNPVPGVGVTFAVGSGGGTLEGPQQTTGSDGTATVESWTLGASPGPNTLQATSRDLAGSPILFTAKATPLATAVTVEVHDDFFRSVRNGSGGASGLFGNYAVDTITAGGTVTWVWMGQNHNVTPSFSGSSLSGNQDAPYTLGPIAFNTPGRYEYRCTNHSHFFADIVVGMAGRMVIR